MQIKTKTSKSIPKSTRRSKAYAKKPRSMSLRKIGQTSASNARVIVITVVVLAMATVGLFAWCANYLRPEKAVYRNIEMIAREFYVEDFYRQSVDSNPKTPAELFSRYAEHGLAPIPLRRLLVFAQTKYPATVQEIEKYCNENTSYVKFFPTEPYGENDFKVEYVNECKIDDK